MGITTRVMMVVLALGAGAPAAAGQDQPTATRDTGERLFRTYCASCHGVTGRGDGPVASELRRPPPDLTGFAVRNRGVFPTQLLRSIIDGRGIRAHGLDDMPVWGDAFSSGPDGLSERAVQARIDAIVAYIEALQVRSARR